MSRIVNFENESYFKCLRMVEEYLNENKLKIHVVATNVTVVDGIVNILLTVDENNITL
ncbi:MAG: hypothetical protein ACRCTZ_18325 [Sarcina sp.]